MNFQEMNWKDVSGHHDDEIGTQGTLLISKDRENEAGGKAKSKKKEIKFNNHILKKHMSFLSFLAFGASDSQLLDMLFEIEPDQLAAIRHVIGNAVKTQKTLVQDFVHADKVDAISQMTRIPPVKKERLMMKGPSAKRIDILKKFLQNLLSEKATRAQLRSKARFIRFAVKTGLDMYDADTSRSSSSGLPFPLKPDQRTTTKSSKANDSGKRDGRTAKNKQTEKNRKRKAEGVRDDGKTVKARRTGGGEKGSGETTGDKRGAETSVRVPGRKEQEEWFHNTFAPSDDDDEEEVSSPQNKRGSSMAARTSEIQSQQTAATNESQGWSSSEEDEDFSTDGSDDSE